MEVTVMGFAFDAQWGAKFRDEDHGYSEAKADHQTEHDPERPEYFAPRALDQVVLFQEDHRQLHRDE